ncbi:MAG: nitroreductase family protein [Actinomycetota bacterium]|nr:nitroreductase family protein [Actinomycetota bacterium]
MTRVLSAAHMAPSVGHCQPWRFIMVMDPATRDRPVGRGHGGPFPATVEATWSAPTR